MPLLFFRIKDQEFYVEPGAGDTLIGSSPEAHVSVPDADLAPVQAVLANSKGGYVVREKGSGGRLRHDGHTVKEIALRGRVHFTVGPVWLLFDEAATAPVLARAADGQAAGGAAPAEEPARLLALAELRRRVIAEVGKAVIGQDAVLEQVLTALLCKGHCLLIGVPGLAKTLIVRSLGRALALESNRVQFTPDLMPSDITGTNILEEDPVTRERRFRFSRGPLFTNLLLADEINRTPPKTQAALLEAMQERRVTSSGATYSLPDPFFVIATQNPIEQEGTYPLPEAELDRFMFCITLGYPGERDEARILVETTRERDAEVSPVVSGAEILAFQQLVRRVPVSEHVARYATALVRASRPGEPGAADFINRWVRWGAGTRAGQSLLLAAKARAALANRTSVSCEDVRAYALPVLRHRIFCNFAAASENVQADEIVKRLLDAVPEPTY